MMLVVQCPPLKSIQRKKLKKINLKKKSKFSMNNQTHFRIECVKFERFFHSQICELTKMQWIRLLFIVPRITHTNRLKCAWTLCWKNRQQLTLHTDSASANYTRTRKPKYTHTHTQRMADNIAAVAYWIKTDIQHTMISERWGNAYAHAIRSRSVYREWNYRHFFFAIGCFIAEYHSHILTCIGNAIEINEIVWIWSCL